MSIKIHWGPPGSYKTAGAVQDDLIPAWKSGRTIITNIRGLNAESLASATGMHPDEGGDLILVDSESAEGRARMARWFHWAPRGALIFVDEAQAVWPKAWTVRDLAELDYPGGTAQAEADSRPHCFTIAIDKHRHYNWDFVLTTPNIRKVRDEIRQAADGGYKHRNLALIGLRGIYVEGFHTAEDNGATPSDFLSITRKRIKKSVFRAYSSTSTGQTTDTISGTPLWKNPRLVGMVGFLIAIFAFLATRPVPAALGGDGASMDSAPHHQPRTVVADQGVRQDSGGSDRGGTSQARLERVKPEPPPVPFSGGEMWVDGWVQMGKRTVYLVNYRAPGGAGTVSIQTTQLEKAGYSVEPVSECAFRIWRDGKARLVECGSSLAQGMLPGV